MPIKVIETFKLKTAREFLNIISPIGDFFNSVELGKPWLFRGQGRDSPLIPSLFRADGKLKEFTKRDINSPKGLRLVERDILIDFFDVADKRGLILPDDSQQLRSTLQTFRSNRGDQLIGEGRDQWNVPHMALSIAALAQHYGLPTRLLDWSRQAHVAAFFAADSAYRHLNDSKGQGSLVVWAFFFPALGKHDELDRSSDYIQVVTAPSATNPNLKAQQGVFTLINPFYTTDEEEGEGKMNYPALSTFLENKVRDAKPELSDIDKLIVDCRLRKFTLPVSQSGELLRLLAMMDVTHSSIFPGYDHIITDLKMRNLWA